MGEIFVIAEHRDGELREVTFQMLWKANDLCEKFDIAGELRDFIRSVVYSYVQEKTNARVEIRLNQLDSAILEGNRHRFRRMIFNLVMNAVAWVAQRPDATLTRRPNMLTEIQSPLTPQQTLTMFYGAGLLLPELLLIAAGLAWIRRRTG